jgi:hypothetical protein
VSETQIAEKILVGIDGDLSWIGVIAMPLLVASDKAFISLTDNPRFAASESLR